MQPIEVLQEDFAQTLAFIDKCDNHMFTVKNWALITTSTVIAFAITQNHYQVAFVNVGLIVAFMYLELIYKSFQDTAIEHNMDISTRIDRFLADRAATDLLVGYNHSFGRKLKYPSVVRVFSLLGNLNRWHILNFYGLLAAFSVATPLVAGFVA
jgi:hypothetical protein